MKTFLRDVKLRVRMLLNQFRYDMRNVFQKEQISTTKWGESQLT